MQKQLAASYKTKTTPTLQCILASLVEAFKAVVFYRHNIPWKLLWKLTLLKGYSVKRANEGSTVCFPIATTQFGVARLLLYLRCSTGFFYSVVDFVIHCALSQKCDHCFFLLTCFSIADWLLVYF